MFNRNFKFVFFITLSSVVGSVLHAQDIDLKNVTTDSGICELRLEKKLNEAYLSTGQLSFPKTYTVTEAPIDRRRGSSPPTGRKIGPLETVNCLFQANNKILVTTDDEMEKSCGWVDEEYLAKTVGSAFSSMGPCGFIEPLSIGDFCKKTSEMVNLDIDTRVILEGCKLPGVRSSNIDTKFVTDNTTSRLSGAIEAGDVVRRQIPVYSTVNADQPSGSVDVFSVEEIYDVKQKKNGQIAILLGVGQRITGWTELQFGHIWYSNLSTYFNPQGTEPVYLGTILKGPSGQPNNNILALKPSEANFNVTSDYAKFPVLFDRRKKDSSSLPNHVPQLQIAFIGKFCDSDDAAALCADQTDDKLKQNLDAADIVFLIDGSKSMQEYFKIVAENLTLFTEDYVGNADYRFGVAMYGDFKVANKRAIGDPIDFKTIRNLEPTYSTDEFRPIQNTNLLTKDALNDIPEAVHAAVYEAAKTFNWAPGKPHILIHIADHGDRDRPTEKVFNELSNRDILYVPIAVEGVKVLPESKTFINDSKIYAERYTKNGNPMAVEALVTYGQGTKLPSDQIADALVAAANLKGLAASSDNQENTDEIFSTLTDAVRDIFKIQTGDSIDILAATGNIKTTDIGALESNWDYFIALPNSILDQLKNEMNKVCRGLGSGSDTKVVETMALRMVTFLTGDNKTPEELAQIFREGSIPLQTETIIGSGIRDLVLKAGTNQDLTPYKKEFCRSSELFRLMIRNKKLGDPEEGQDLVWNDLQNSYDAKNQFDFNWAHTDANNISRYYLPLTYLPRPQTN
jgi:hypothetical protein